MLLCSLQVLGCTFKMLDCISDDAHPSIAVVAEKPANLTSCVVMVDGKPRDAMPRDVWHSTADGTDTALLLVKHLVLVLRNAVLLD